MTTGSSVRRRRRPSPWWIALGATGLSLYGGLIAAVSYLTVRMAAPSVKSLVGEVEASAKNPAKPVEVARTLPGIPVYPQAKLNPRATRNPALRYLTGKLDNSGAVLVAFDTEAELATVIRWYQQNLRGWRRVEGWDGSLPFVLPVQSATFTRRGQLLVVLPGLGRSGLGQGSFVLCATGVRPARELTELVREVRAHPEDPRRRTQLALRYQFTLDHPRAMSQWRALLKLPASRLPPRDRYLAQFHLGLCNWRLRRNPEALAWFRRASEVATTPDEREQVWQSLVVTLQALERPGEAEALLLAELDRGTRGDAAGLHAQLARLYHELGRLNDAVEEYEIADRLGARGTRMYRARAELALGNEARARELLLQATRDHPRFVPRFLEDVRTGRPPRRAWVGVQLTGVTAEWAAALGLEQPGAVWVEEVVPDSPAFHQGLQRQDLIIAVGKQPALQADDVLERLRQSRPGDVIELAIWRDGRSVPITLRLGSILQR